MEPGNPESEERGFRAQEERISRAQVLMPGSQGLEVMLPNGHLVPATLVRYRLYIGHLGRERDYIDRTFW